MRAFTSQAKTDVNASFYPCQYDLSNTFPRRMPNLAVSFPAAIPSQLDDVLKTHGYTNNTYKGKKIMIFEKPDVSLVRLIMGANAITTTPSPANSANISAIGSLSLVQRVFSNFLRTHHYPAFKTPEHMNEIAALELEKGDGKGKRKAPRDATGGRKKKRGQSSTATELPTDAEMEIDDQDSPENPSADVFYASPPYKDSKGWGTVDDVPHCHGIFVPFVLDLADPDPKMVPSVLKRYFLGCLGVSTESIRQTMHQVESAWGVLAFTEVGHEMAHMAKCIELALEGQAQCFPLFEDERYNGCVLVGAGFSVISGDETFVPVDYDVLRAKITEFGTHNASLKGIAMIVGLDEKALEELDDENRTPITSMYMLSQVLVKTKITEATKDDVLKLAVHLHFGRSWSFNFNTLEKALTLLSSDDPLPRDLPIHSSFLFSTNRVELVWSCFGAMAPTPHYPSSTMWDLTKTARPTKMCFRHVKLTQAIADIKTVISSKKISVPAGGGGRSAPYKDVRFLGNEAKALLVHFTKLIGGTEVVEGSGIADMSVTGADNLFQI